MNLFSITGTGIILMSVLLLSKADQDTNSTKTQSENMKTQTILKKTLSTSEGNTQHFTLIKERVDHSQLGAVPNRILKLISADNDQLTNAATVWVGAELESNDPNTRWITDIVPMEQESKKLLLVGQVMQYYASLKVYEVDLTKPVPTIERSAEILQKIETPIASLDFKYISPLDTLVSAEMFLKEQIIEINGVSQRVGGVRGGSPEPFVIKFNCKTRCWEIPSELTKKINLTVDKNK